MSREKMVGSVDVRTKKLANGFALIFFTTTLLLTLFAGNVHAQAVPKAAGQRAGKKDFPYTITLEDGMELELTYPKLAVPESLFRDGGLWVLTELSEGEYVIDVVSVETGVVLDGYVEIVGGLTERHLLFLGSDREVMPGTRVLLAGNGGEEISDVACAVFSAALAADPGAESGGTETEEKGTPEPYSVFEKLGTFGELVKVSEEGGEYHIYTRPGLEQVVYYELRQCLPQAALRSPYLEGVLRKDKILVGCLAGVTVLLATACIAFRKKKYGWLRAALVIVWLVAAGFMLREQFVLPSEWAPRQPPLKIASLTFSAWPRCRG